MTQNDEKNTSATPESAAADGTKKPTFEQALSQLEQIVSQIESGEVSLEGSIEKYAQGTKLLADCREILDSAEKKIQLLARSKNGQLAPTGDLPAEE